MTLRVLVIEPHAEDVLFLRDVLAELDEGRSRTGWWHLTVSYAATCTEAAAIVADAAVDLVLLDLETTGGAGAFRRIHLAAPQIPVILIVDAARAPLAERLLREGAQDFLVKDQVDCAPLAHAISSAVARHQLLSATRAISMTDSLTGLLSRSAFLALAERDRLLADRLERRMILIVARPRNLDQLASAFGEHRRDLELVEAADYLRSMAGPADLTARLDDASLATCVFETECESVEEAWARLHAGTAARKISLGAAVFDPGRPVSLDMLLEQAAHDLQPSAAAAAAGAT